MKQKRIVFIILSLVTLIWFWALESKFTLADAQHPEINLNQMGMSNQRIKNGIKPDINFGKFPLYFVANHGQVNDKARFYAKASRYTLWITKQGLVFDSWFREVNGKQEQASWSLSRNFSPEAKCKKYRHDVSRILFMNANKDPEIVALDNTVCKVNYFIGNDKSKWLYNIPTSQAVMYKELYENIDLKVYGIEKQIEYDWVIKPGGDPDTIRFQYQNVESTYIDKSGNLIIVTKKGQLMHKRPSSFQIETAQNLYSTYIGGSLHDSSLGIAVDNRGYAYITGSTASADFPSRDKFMDYHGGGDCFLTILNPELTGTDSLLFSTFLGGIFEDTAYDIASYGTNKVVVTGFTSGTDFPVKNQWQDTQWANDGILFMVDFPAPSQAELVFSTYVGANALDRVRAVATDGGGNIYVTGYTTSTNFPVKDEFMTDNGDGTFDVFITKFSFSPAVDSPTVITDAASGIGTTVATLNGRVNANNAETIVTFQYGTTDTYGTTVTADQSPVRGSAETAVSTAVTGLTPGTFYHYRVVGENAGGTVFGTDMTFATSALPVLATVTTSAVVNITTDSADSGGEITDDGGSTVTERGVCWSTTPDPNTAPYKTSDGSGTGIFSSRLTGLRPNTKYYIWAYATNTAGTAYGNMLIFKTRVNPTISGYATYDGNPLQDVGINFSHDGKMVLTDVDGFYSYTVPYDTTTTATATKQGFLFKPTQYEYINLNSSVQDQDFIARQAVSVTIISPQDSAVLSGKVSVEAEILEAVAYVEFFVDGASVKQDKQAPYKFNWNTKKYSDGTYSLVAVAHDLNGLTGEDGITVTVDNSNNNGPPHISLNRTRLNFGGTVGSSRPVGQKVHISNTGGGTLAWRATVSESWIRISPYSGGDNTTLQVWADGSKMQKGSYRGKIEISDDNADNSPINIDVFLIIKDKKADLPPIGLIELPMNNVTVFGSIPVTGWALDDMGGTAVRIYRNPVWGIEIGLVYIGEAIFVEGARPDVEFAYPDYPGNYRAGWGYMLLTNSLPNQGNGSFVLTAIASDSGGNEKVLGSRTIICDNANSGKPFGTIDTPASGEQITDSKYVNFGWALTPQPNSIATDGSGIQVVVDGFPLGHPEYGRYRQDIADAFPGYNNSNGAVGYFYLDTTMFEDGLHTIQWWVEDNAGNRDGIGSRYFYIAKNGAIPMGFNSKNQEISFLGAPRKMKHLSRQVLDNMPVFRLPLIINTGYKAGNNQKKYQPDPNGIIRIKLEPAQRLEIDFSSPDDSLIFGGMLKGGIRLKLPIGSRLDLEKKRFYWQPGPVFKGEFTLFFVQQDNLRHMTKRIIKVVIGAID